ncbi:MAG: pyrroline-5-carboxylate reductase [Gammaproteobacteria bacterium]|nr:pyrroline-5-carboxylate reductase [Gammaproteobacteria bacterium]
MQIGKIGFIGAGNMASAIIGGLIASGCKPTDIWVSDVDERKLQDLQQRHGLHVANDNAQLLEKVDVLLLAVKPQIMKSVLKPLAPQVQQRKPLVISVAAGLPTADLSRWLGGEVALVRTMPNTPALVRSGATALFANERVTAHQHEVAESIMRATGLALWVEQESQMDAVTALSGSGPAYFFLLIESMQKAGEQLGLEAETARLLALQTAFGAAKLALEADDGAAALRAKVTSPGGTTEQAINVFMQRGMPEMVAAAMTAADQRAQELAKQLGAD